MKKSLKKVISAIAALALSASSFVAFAADFPDVADTADYAKAVDQLTGMGIVEGREDGTFDPDATVTRAEMSTMIIRALGSEAAAKSMAGRDTVFRDVPGGHWAAGYVAVANTISPQFIQGMGDGTFAPDATVTYAQAVTMLVRALGYETMAAPGGYPNGYLGQAGSIGMLNGFSTQNNDAELNRGQVAILIDNAVVNCPILGEGDWYQTWNGGMYAPEIKDGTIPGYSNFWKSLATTKHDTYQVFGTVTETRTSTSNSTLDADEVKLNIQRSKNFNEVSFGFGYYTDLNNDLQAEIYNVGDTDAAENFNQYAEMLIKKTNDDEYVIVAFTPNGRTDNLVFKATQYDSEKTGANYGNERALYFTNESGGSPRPYRLSTEGATWYVNGTEIFSPADNNAFPAINVFEQYLVENGEAKNFVGEVTLTDYKGTNGSSTPDGRYDSVNITYYFDAVVDEVTVNNAGRVSITFLDNDSSANGTVKSALSSPFQYDPEDEDKVITFKGAATKYEELQQYDVLSFQIEPNKSAKDSNNTTVTVSRNSQTGTVSMIREHDPLTNAYGYTIGGEYYTANGNMSPGIAVGGNKAPLESSSEYTIYLDAFGFIAYAELGSSAKNYAVVDRMYVSEGGSSYKVKIIAADGSTPVYDYYRTGKDFLTDAEKYAYNGINGDSANLKDANRKLVQDRVVTYIINGSGQLRITGGSGAADSTKIDMREATGDSTYVLSSNRIGNIRLGDNTDMLDLTDYYASDGEGDVSVMGSLQDGQVYEAYGYGRSTTDQTYKFVIVTKGTSGLNADSPLAIIKSKASTDYGDGSTTQLVVFTEGEELDLVLDVEDKDGAKNVIDNLDVGDAFIYQLGTDNRIIRAAAILNANFGYGDGNYARFVNDAFTKAENAMAGDDANHTFLGENGTYFDAALDENAPRSGNYTTVLNGSFKGAKNSEDAYFTFGPVLENKNGVTIAKLETKDGNYISHIDSDTTNYSLDSDCYLYAYDWTQKSSDDRLGTTSGSSAIQRVSYPKTPLEDAGGYYISWNDYGIHSDTVNENNAYNQCDVTFSLLKIYGGDVTVGYTMLTP